MDEDDESEEIQYTGEGVEVTISSADYVKANEGKDPTDADKLMKIQYFIGDLTPEIIADNSAWTEYNKNGEDGTFLVTENGNVNVRLVCEEDNFKGPITTVVINNIAVARIQTGTPGDEDEYTYYPTLDEAIKAVEEMESDTPIVIEMIANTTESVKVPAGVDIVIDLNGHEIKSATKRTGTVEPGGEEPENNIIGKIGDGGEEGIAIIIEGTLKVINSKEIEENTPSSEITPSTVGGITSTKTTAIKVENGGVLTLGEDDYTGEDPNRVANVNTQSPIISGGDYGVIVENGGEINFYDGIIKGKENAVQSSVADEDINDTVTGKPENYGIAISQDGEYEVAVLAKKSKVTVDAKDGTITDANGWEHLSVNNKTADKVLIAGTEYGELPVAERVGYTFIGWNGKNLFDLSSVGTSKATINGQEVILDASDVVGNTGTQIHVQKWEGENFKGGISNTSSIENHKTYTFVKDASFDKLHIKVNTNLQDPWITLDLDKLENGKTYTCSFDVLNIGEAKATICNIQLEENSQETTFEPYIINSNTKFTNETDTTLTAIYTPNQYTIQFNPNIPAEEGPVTGTTENATFTYDEPARLPVNGFVRPGYVFAGWVDEATLAEITAGTKTPDEATKYVQETVDGENKGAEIVNLAPSGTITLYAIWKDVTEPGNEPPTGTVTQTTVTVICNQTDSGSGIDPDSIEYRIGEDKNKNGVIDEDEDETWLPWQGSAEFTVGIKPGTTYVMQTKASDKEGNGPTESQTETITTDGIIGATTKVHEYVDDTKGEEIATYEEPTGTPVYVNTDIIIDVTLPEGVEGAQAIVTVKGPDETEQVFTVTTNENDPIVETLDDGEYIITTVTKVGDIESEPEAQYVYIDKTPPTITTTTLSTTSSISVTDINAEDEGSGPDETTVTYVLMDETNTNIIGSPNTTGIFPGLTHDTTYILITTIEDNAGNVGTEEKEVKTNKLEPASLAFAEATSKVTFTPAKEQENDNIWINENVDITLTKVPNADTTYEVKKVEDVSRSNLYRKYNKFCNRR